MVFGPAIFACACCIHQLYCRLQIVHSFFGTMYYVYEAKHSTWFILCYFISTVYYLQSAIELWLYEKKNILKIGAQKIQNEYRLSKFRRLADLRRWYMCEINIFCMNDSRKMQFYRPLVDLKGFDIDSFV